MATPPDSPFGDGDFMLTFGKYADTLRELLFVQDRALKITYNISLF